MGYKAVQQSFFEQVYEVVRQVPYGRVTTYGLIARYLGTGQSARMVGWAMNAAHGVTPPVPAHRVVNRNGLLTGRHHFPTEDMMEQLLTMEGVQVENHQVLNFKEKCWDPANHLQRGEF